MRARRYVIWIYAVSAFAGLALSGCGSDDKAGPQTTDGSNLSYDSFGTKAGIDCADGRSLDIGGSNNTITVTGSCESVTVSGADNKIHFDRVERSLVVDGLNNTVVYAAGEPEVVNRGTGNDIRQG